MNAAPSMIGGVFFAPMSSTDIDGMPRWQADLFTNAVSAAIDN